MPMHEAVGIPTFQRSAFLYVVLERIRAVEPTIPIHVFPDRGSLLTDPEVETVCSRFCVTPHWVPDHRYHGNSYNVMEMYRWAFNSGVERFFMIEDDVIVHHDFFNWHRAQLEQWSDLFCSMGWIFNRHAPIVDQELFQPWFYSIGVCFTRDMLRHVVKHASPLYYEDMQGYIEKNFDQSKLNTPFGIEHYEQDGLIQRIIDQTKLQTVSPGIAKCDHIGLLGYNRGWSQQEDFFKDCLSLKDRVRRVREFAQDEYWRADIFGRDIVEREIGRELPKREFCYRMTIGPWSSNFTSELKPENFPRRINSVPVTDDVEFVLIS